MRFIALLLVLASLIWISACARTRAGTKVSPTTESSDHAAQNSKSAKVDFQTQIQPVLQAKCQPCHFSGGKVYSSMPFDRPQTIKTLGTKLFTRIKDENERRLIREFLAQE
jgi:uncharacterized membrane protein